MPFLRTGPRRTVVLVTALLLFAVAGARSDLPGIANWRPLYVGVDYGAVSVATPRPLRAHALRIDLRAPGLSFFATPDGKTPEYHTIGLKTSTFLAKHRLQAAINAASFGPIHRDEGKPVRIVGLTISRGRIVSPPTALPALAISKRNEAKILEAPLDTSGVENAVAGFGVVLRRGKVTGASDELHPRTAAGISADGRTLYLLVVDGRQPGYSEGITTAEVGEWLRALGAADGINLDGGGTTTLVVEDAKRKPVVLNTPIHANVPGTERVSGSHLGIRARRLPRGPRLPIAGEEYNP